MKTQADLGWLGPDAEDIIVTNRSGASWVVGDVNMIDWRETDGDSLAASLNAVGDANSGICNSVANHAVTTSAVGFAIGIFCCAQVAAANDAKGRVRLRGAVDACAVDGTVTLATSYCTVKAGPDLEVIDTAQETSGAVAATPHKVIFIPLQARTGAGTVPGWFNGVEGFGSVLQTEA